MSHQNVLRSLEIIFGNTPALILEDAKYLSYNDTDDNFTCVPCDKIIQKSNSNTDNTTNNFVKHLDSFAHKNNTISINELMTNLNSTFLGKIPPIVLMNRHKLGMNDRNYECVICEKTIQVHSSTSLTENNFSYHLLSTGHEENLEDLNKTLSQLYEIYGGISRTIMNHSRFLSKNGQHYLCTICNKQLMVHPTDVEETEKCFEKHLHSLKHLRNAKQEKAFSLTPKLKQIFSCLPNYMLRNIEYISINASNFFCSLCNENIIFNGTDPYETKLSFKLHISSPTHEENLNNRRDPDNEVFNRLCSIFEELPDVVQENLQYLTVNEDEFYCGICKETIIEHHEQDQTMDTLVLHFESVNHESMVNSKNFTSAEAHQDLKDIFGTIPEIIQCNLQHIKFNGGKNFECFKCHKIIKAKFDGDYEDNITFTERNFEHHLDSNGHKNKLDLMEEINDNLISDLGEIFYPIPQFIMHNLNHLTYDNDSDNFECFLCDKVIAVVPGNKKAELTEQNFRNHFLSVGHLAKLKHRANLIMEATDKLESIFNKVPNFILANIQHLEVEGNYYRCTLCDAKITRGGVKSTEIHFCAHLYGSHHTSNLEYFENENDEAFQRLDRAFWRVPEFTLRNIDFLSTFYDDLFCLLCQEKLTIDEEDVEWTKNSLRSHMDSEMHQCSLTNI